MTAILKFLINFEQCILCVIFLWNVQIIQLVKVSSFIQYTFAMWHVFITLGCQEGWGCLGGRSSVMQMCVQNTTSRT